MRLIHLLLFHIILLASISAQDAPQRPYRQIRTIEAMELIRKAAPETADNQSSIERYNRKKGKKAKTKKMVLPLVFHILYTSEKDQIALEQIEAQIEALNRDFANQEEKELEVDKKENFAHKATDTEISFCLAKDKRNFYPINYVQTTTSGWSISNQIKKFEMGGVDPVDPESYINVWVGDLAEDVSGYAQMPGGPKKTDGIVIDYRFFGTGGTAVAPYDEGKTLTHLMGNYLNLYPLWGQYHCTDDYVHDTPIHNGPNFGKPVYEHISACNGYPTEMISNFMDNTDDAYLHFFTHGQKTRMQAVLAEGAARSGLLKAKVECGNVNRLFEKSASLEQAIFSQEAEEISMRLYPNPTNQKANLELITPEAGAGIIRIFDLKGKLQHSQVTELVPGQQRILIDCHNWVPGIYLFQVIVGDKSLSDELVISR